MRRNLLRTSLDKAVSPAPQRDGPAVLEKWRLTGVHSHASGSSREPATRPQGRDEASEAPNFLQNFYSILHSDKVITFRYAFLGQEDPLE